MKLKANKLDIWGASVSLLCAIHCALLPLLLSIGLLQSFSFLDHVLFEVIILGFTAFFVYTSIIRSYLHNRQSIWPLFLGVSGLILVLLHFVSPIWATPIVVLGGLCIATAHLINLNISTRSKLD